MTIIGRRDYLDLPNLGFDDIQAKIDTGAYGCSLHSHQIEVIKREDQDVLRFKLLDLSHPEYQGKFCYATEFNDKIVKSSTGIPEHRYTIKTKVAIFKKIYSVEFSLADRAEMKYPILLGRKFLRKRFVVDVSLKNLSKRKINIQYENSSIIKE